MSIYKDAVKDALYPKKKGLITKTNKYISVREVKSLTKEEVREIRHYLQLSTSLFAEVLGVSKKTVEAWESGINRPSGSASRLMMMARKNPDILLEGGAVIDRTSMID